MPLAIELAAARVKFLTPDQILARLEHHLDLLSAGSRDLPERQQTLRGAIGWSYDLLDDGSPPAGRSAFGLPRRLRPRDGGACVRSGRRGRWRRRRAGRRARRPEPRSPRRDPTREPRFAMLETIREYAAEMLAGAWRCRGDRRPPCVRDARARRGGGSRVVGRRPADVAGSTRARPRQHACRPRLGRRRA